MRTRIKICGITRLQDAQGAVELGTDALGFIFWKPSPRYIDPAAAREIIRALPAFIATVGVFVDPGAEEVRQAVSASGISTLQFHGRESADFCAAFERPWLKAFKPSAEGDLLKSTAPYEHAAGWLFDAYDEKRMGGTGETFDWSLLPRKLARPLILSGGLNPGNVGEAIRRMRPYAVDVSSGVEAGKGIKDAAKMAAFVQGVRDAGQ